MTILRGICHYRRAIQFELFFERAVRWRFAALRHSTVAAARFWEPIRNVFLHMHYNAGFRVKPAMK